MTMTLADSAHRLGELLETHAARVVFAESCTAGLVSAAMAEIPGISEYLCGSMVVYRIATKQHWLEIDQSILEAPGPVSEVVARQMAMQVLGKTHEADWSASITGHLGPDAPPALDGVIFVGVARRDGRGLEPISVHAHRYHLDSTAREQRQREAAELTIRFLYDAICAAH